MNRLIAVAAIATIAPGASAATCTLSGSPLAYVNCIRDAVDSLADEVAVLRADLDGRPVNEGAVPITMSKMPFTYEDSVLHYTAPDGSEHSLDLDGMGAGDTRTSSGERIKVVRGNLLTDTAVYFDLTGVSTPACTLLHHDDDNATPGWYYATDRANHAASVWTSDRPTFELRKDGEGDIPFEDWAGFAILCF